MHLKMCLLGLMVERRDYKCAAVVVSGGHTMQSREGYVPI